MIYKFGKFSHFHAINQTFCGTLLPSEVTVLILTFWRLRFGDRDFFLLKNYNTSCFTVRLHNNYWWFWSTRCLGLYRGFDCDKLPEYYEYPFEIFPKHTNLFIRWKSWRSTVWFDGTSYNAGIWNQGAAMALQYPEDELGQLDTQQCTARCSIVSFNHLNQKSTVHFFL